MRDGFLQLSRKQVILLVGPPPVGNGDLVGVWPVFGLGHLEKFRARAENRKAQFSGARGPKTEKKNTTLSGMVVRNFLTFYVLTDRTPRGGKNAKYKNFGPFGLGRPLALIEIPGPGRKQKIAISRC